MNATLTAIRGVEVGHAHDLAAITGCSVVLLPEGSCGGVDVRGGAPATRETDLFDPSATVQRIDAICLSGGSAFGLAAADGVMRWLHEQGRGLPVRGVRIPIVSAACIFDLAIGASDCWPDSAMGYEACRAATAEAVAEGCVGAGTGATAGKVRGMEWAMKSGVGSSALVLPGGITVAALAVTNPIGDIYRDGTREIIAGARRPGGGFLDSAAVLRSEPLDPPAGRLNTTLAVVVTDARLDKAGCRKLAQMAQDALARTIRPVHTPADGDIVFAVATGEHPAPGMLALGSAAADALTAAIERSALAATGMGGLPAAGDP